MELIAEIGSACDGGLELTLATIEALEKAGVDGVKLQCHTGQTVPDKHPDWARMYSSATRRQYLQAQEWTVTDWARVKEYCDSIRMRLIISPFSVAAAALVAPYVDEWKIASGQALNRELRGFLTDSPIPIWASCGMHDPLTVSEFWSGDAALYLCASDYPTVPERSPILTADLAPYRGYSSHEGMPWAIYAAAFRGLERCEFHVRPCALEYGTDAGPHSIELSRVPEIVDNVRAISRARKGSYTPDPNVRAMFSWPGT